MSVTSDRNCSTKNHFTFIWTVENGSALSHSVRLKSTVFTAQLIENTKWSVSARGMSHRKGAIFFLRRDNDSGPESIEIEYEFSILDLDGSPLEVKTGKEKCERKRLFRLATYKDFHEILFKRISKFVRNDDITFRCRMGRFGVELSKSDTCFARTCLYVDRRSFIWPIKDFSNLQPELKRTVILSPTLTECQQLIMNLFLRKKNGKNYVTIELTQNTAEKTFLIFCKMSVLDSDGRVAHSEETNRFINPYQNICTFEEFIEKDKLMSERHSLLQNDILYLRCELLLNAVPVWNGIECCGYSNLEHQLPETTTNVLQELLDRPNECCASSCPFKKTLEDLYGHESLSDVSLRVGAGLFPAHKSVLSARSPIFEAMFQDMSRWNQIIDIPDLNAATLGRLLLSIYKNTVEDLQLESAMHLFKAASKYQILDIRKKCSLFLESSICVSNVCTILSLAHAHEDSDLLKAAEDFISGHDEEVFKSDEWKKFKGENFRLALAIMENVIQRINRRSIKM